MAKNKSRIKVFCYFTDSIVKGKKFDRRTILIKKNKLPDKDGLIVTDKHGFRYARTCIHLENDSQYMFNQI